MKIVITGAGEVGSQLVKMLSVENHEIIILDNNPEKLDNLVNRFDLMPIEGNATSFKSLEKAEAGKCDLFIAVTPFESENLNACMLASSMGAKKTIARVNNYEYMLPENKSKFEKIGINSLIYPESLAANEIRDALKSSWQRFKMTFSEEKLILLGVKLYKNAPLLNQKFKTGFLDHGRFRVVAIKRENETIIPKGDDELLVNDFVFFITTEENIDFTREQAGKVERNIKNIMIMGGSRIGVKTAQFLPDKINAKIIELNYERCINISEKLPKTLVLHGDARDMDLLKDEGIKDTDAFIALTENSEANILACLAAKRFGVIKTIAEIENLDYIPLAQSLDIGTIINKKLIAASYIYQQTLDESVLNIKWLPMSDAQIIEFQAKQGSKITKGSLRDINIPQGVNFGGYIRDDHGYICSGDTQIQAGDHVIVFCCASDIRRIESLFYK
jgi:trk system potassium uptake protein TrkA